MSKKISKRAKVVQKVNPKTEQKEYAFVSDKDSKKTLEYLGKKKPSDEKIKSLEKRKTFFENIQKYPETMKKVVKDKKLFKQKKKKKSSASISVKKSYDFISKRSSHPYFDLDDIFYRAQEGSLEARYKIATAYRFGTKGIRKNTERALKHLVRAASDGYIKAQLDLYSICQEQGHKEEALEWLQLAAEQKDSTAINLLSKHKLDKVTSGKNQGPSISYGPKGDFNPNTQTYDMRSTNDSGQMPGMGGMEMVDGTVNEMDGVAPEARSVTNYTKLYQYKDESEKALGRLSNVLDEYSDLVEEVPLFKDLKTKVDSNREVLNSQISNALTAYANNKSRSADWWAGWELAKQHAEDDDFLGPELSRKSSDFQQAYTSYFKKFKELELKYQKGPREGLGRSFKNWQYTDTHTPRYNIEPDDEDPMKSPLADSIINLLKLSEQLDDED